MNSFPQKRNTFVYILLILCCVFHGSAQVVPVLKYVSPMIGTNNTTEDFAMDAAGNTYSVGSMWGTVDFDPGPGTYNLTSLGGFDVFVSKMDPSGNLVWARTFGGSKYEQGFGIAVDLSGNVYTTGRFVGTTDFDPGAATYKLTATGTGYANAFISKLNSNGDFVWAVALGGTQEDVGESIAVDASGNVHVIGTFSYTVDFDPGASTFSLSGNAAQIFILKLNTNAGFIWAKAITGTYQTYPKAISLDAAGNVYTTGSWYASTMDFDPGPGVYTLTPNSTSTDMFISKLDINGGFVWAKAIGNQYTESGEDIELDNSGNILLTGIYVASVDFDPGAGVSNMTSAEPTGDIFILKLANDGTYLWSKTMGGVGIVPSYTNENRGIAITADLTGNIFVTGRFSSSGDFDPGPGIVTLNANSTSYTDMFISKFDAAGNLIWATDLGSGGFDFGSGIRTDAAGAVYIGGQSQGVVDFDPSACVFNAGSGFTAFVLKLGEAPPIPAPTIASFTPTSGPIGTPVTITGTNFSTVDAENGVTFFNNKPALVSGSSLTTINTSVPTATTTGVIKVTVACVTVSSTGNFTITVGPTITSFTPTTGSVNTTVTITGTNFSTTPANNLVKFNGTTATVTSSTATSIVTKVPAGATTGTISVTVAGSTGTSTGVFTVPGTINITTQPAATTSVCVGATVTLGTAATGTTNIIYQWQFSTTLAGTYVSISNTGGYSNVGTATLSINTSGNFGAGYYRCKVDGDAAATKFTNAVGVLVNSKPSPPTASGYIACDYGSGGLAYLYAAGGSAGNYRWYTVASGGTAISGETNYLYTPTVTANSTFYVSIASGTCESTRTPAVVEYRIGPQKPTITSSLPIVNNKITVCPGGLVLSGPAGHEGYLWSPVQDGGQQLVVKESGSYTVQVYDNVCYSEDSDPIDVTIDATNCVNAAPVITFQPISIPINGKVTLDLIPTLSDSDNNIDLKSLSIVEPPQSGAEATIAIDGTLEIDYSSIQFSGTDRLRIGVCDYFNKCAEQELVITVIGDIVVYNGISPNKDGANDTWLIQYIDAIEETKNNKVSIFNRWGDEVFSVNNYDNTNKVFKGLGKSGNELPSGTYYYKIEFESGRPSKTGYLTLKK